MPEKTPDPMTDSQRQALQKAWDILTEHFDRVVLTVDFETEGADGVREDCHEGFWHGGAMAAVGLSEFSKLRILESKSRDNEPE